VPSLQSKRTTTLFIAADDDTVQERRQVLQGMAIAGFTLLASPLASNALVKGVAPPPPKKASGDKPKCKNVEECQEMAYIREQEMREVQEEGPPPKTTAGGIRYRDTEDGSGAAIKDGDEVLLYYKVLKLGKRSYDGLSGEGTVVFSRGA
jgi:FKBP-type peptidyl-prolyl cis-trans isomerase